MIENLTVEDISGKVSGIDIQAPGRDGVQVYWYNIQPKVGMVTVVCYGRCWTGYFGGMPFETIQEFVKEAGMDYLLNKLSPLKSTKVEQLRLKRILELVKEALKGK